MNARSTPPDETAGAPPDRQRRAAQGAAERGRGATFNPANRFRSETREVSDDGWQPLLPEDATTTGEVELPPLKTIVTLQRARSIIARNDSPDIPFTQSINPYQGCEHGCVYCYARPSHAYLDLSPGFDFESRLFAKPDAAALLRQELAKPGYVCDPIALGTNTDPYQPIERELRITRQILEVLVEHAHPFSIVTKSALVERDLDLIAPMAARNMARVYISITSLDRDIARTLEPRAAAPQRRLQAVRTLSEAGVPVGVMVAPVIPGLTDHDLEAILDAAVGAGARYAGWIMLRLPREVAPLFRDWLQAHHPLRAAHVMSLVNQVRGGRDYDAAFGTRMRGTGTFAQLIEKRFELATRRLKLARDRVPLDRTQFRPPKANTAQQELF